jgi:two-component system, cell cycle sensor histidine kinase and response regulator CckA
MTVPINVLILEDREEDAELMLRHLRLGGFAPDWRRVDSESEYLTHLDWPPDVILADHTLPQFDALRACGSLRERDLDIPCIIVSGTIGEEAAVRAMREGATDYVLKDRLTRLASAVEQALSQKSLRDEHARAVAALAESEARYRSLVGNLPVVAWTADRAGNTEFISPNVVDICGYTPEEVLGADRAWWNELVHPDDGERVYAAFEELFAANRPFEIEFRLTRKDGRLAWIQSRAGAPYVRRGVAYADGILADVTDHKRLEERLRLAHRLESVGRLAGGVAHDFNNLLTVITGYSDAALKKLGTDDPLRAEIEEIHAAGERAADLTRQLLAFSRKQMLQPKVIDLNAIIGHMVRLLERIIGEDIELRLIPDPTLGRTKADPGQIEQVLANLVVNARDAMPRGGLLTIETRNVDLGEHVARTLPDVAPGPYVMVAINDTGHGMEDATLARIFEPFFTTKGEGKGTGLGLATVYGIVKQSGGSIAVYSEVGAGTTFKVYLPRVDEALSVAEPQRAIEQPLGGSETVLIAEDEEGVRKIVSRVLGYHGYTMLEATNGGDAIRVCEAHEKPIDLLITDVVMPGMSGHQLAETLKAIRPELRVLYMSGYTENAIVHHGIVDKAAAFIHKPFTPEALARRVRQVLDGGP